MRNLWYSIALAVALGSASCVVKTSGTTGTNDPADPPEGEEVASNDRPNEAVPATRPAPAQPQPGAERPNEKVPATRPGPAQPQPGAERPNEKVPATRPGPAQPQPGAERPNEKVPSTRPGPKRPFSIEPTAGPVGTTVTIYGDFTLAKRPSDLGVAFNGARGLTRPKTVAADEITVVVPKRATTGAVSVTLRRRVLWTGEFAVTEVDDGILVPTEGGQGLLGSVYTLPPKTNKLPDFATLGAPFATITVPNLDVKARNFKAGFPGLGGKKANLLEWFAIRFEGQLQVPNTGAYEFRTLSDDGSKLYIDGKLVVDNDGVHPPREKSSGPINLTAGSHHLVVEYFQGPRFQIAAQLFWRPAGKKWDIIKPRFFRRR